MYSSCSYAASCCAASVPEPCGTTQAQKRAKSSLFIKHKLFLVRSVTPWGLHQLLITASTQTRRRKKRKNYTSIRQKQKKSLSKKATEEWSFLSFALKLILIIIIIFKEKKYNKELKLNQNCRLMLQKQTGQFCFKSFCQNRFMRKLTCLRKISSALASYVRIRMMIQTNQQSLPAVKRFIAVLFQLLSFNGTGWISYLSAELRVLHCFKPLCQATLTGRWLWFNRQKLKCDQSFDLQ